MAIKIKEYNLKVKCWSPKPNLRVRVPFLLIFINIKLK